MTDTQPLPQSEFSYHYPTTQAKGGFCINKTLTHQFDKPPPKKHNILSIDGGGVRCVIAMEALCSLEKSIQTVSGDPNRLLSDEFDLIAGTSAGGMLASAIATGMSMKDIRVFVEQNIQFWFSPMRWFKRHKALYDKTRLAGALREGLGETTTLGSNKLKTGLMLMTHNWSEDVEWLLTNRQGAAPDNDPDDSHLDLLLWQATLASASAPAYFTPETVRYGRQSPRDVVLQDGGMTGHLNPAFRAFRYATQCSKGPQWTTGEDSLNLVSIGSGDATFRRIPDSSRRRGVMRAMIDTPNTLLQCSVREQEALCELYGRSSGVSGAAVSSYKEVTRKITDNIDSTPKQFSYYRINPCLDTSSLSALGFSTLTAGKIMPMDKCENYNLLSVIGQKTAYATQMLSIVESCFDNPHIPTSCS